MDRFVDSIISSGPVAALLLYLFISERKERMELQNKYIHILTSYATIGESTRDALKELREKIGVIERKLPSRNQEG